MIINQDGTVDRLAVTFSEPVDYSDSGTDEAFDLNVTGGGTASIDNLDYSATGVTLITFNVTPTAVGNTGITIAPVYNNTRTSTVVDGNTTEMANGETITGTDGSGPAVISATTFDADTDGRIDAIDIQFSENIVDASSTLDATTFAVTGYTDTGITSGTANDAFVTIDLTEILTGDGDTDAQPNITLANSLIEDGAPSTNSITIDQSFTSTVDAVAPAITDAAYQDSNTDGFIDQFEITFSEAIDAASSNFSADDLNLTSIGDFTTAEFGNDATDLSANATSIVVPLGIISTNRVTEDLSGLALSTQNNFNISDGTNDNTSLVAQTWITFTDEAFPVITDFAYQDADEDGRIDQVEFFFSEDLASSSVLRPNDLSFADDGDFDGALFGTSTANTVGAGGETNAVVVFGTEATVVDTEENSALLSIDTQNGFSLVDDAGNDNNVLTTQTQANTIDDAAPQIADFEYLDGFDAGETQGDGQIDAIRLTFSENLDAASVLSNNDLSFVSVGDFTGAAFGTDATNLLGGGELTLDITLGTEATIADTESGGIIIASQNAFSLSDGLNVNSVIKSQTQASFTDGAAPALVSAEYLDTSANGQVDRVDVTYSESMASSTFEAGDWDFPNNVDGLVVSTGTFSGNDLQIVVTSAPDDNTALNASITVQYTDQGTASSIVDAAGNVSPTSLVTGVSDAAPPQIADFIYEDFDGGGSRDGQIDQFRVTFTETLDASSVLSANDLTFNNVGDFTGAAFGADGTDLITSAVTEVVVVLGTESTNIDTNEGTGDLEISTQNAFSLTDGVNVNNALIAQLDTDVNYVDGAAPQIVSFEYRDGFEAGETQEDGRIDAFEVTFSEALDASSQLTPNDLQLDDVGDFTSASFGASTTNTVTGGSSTAIVPLGNEATVIDTEDDGIGGTLAISSINGFSLSDGVNTNTVPELQTNNFLDGASPVVVQSVTLDVNEDGDVDRVELEVSEPISDSEFTGEAGNFALTPPAAFGTSDVMTTFDSDVTDLNGGVAVNNDEFFSYTFTPSNSTGTGVFTLQYTAGRLKMLAVIF